EFRYAANHYLLSPPAGLIDKEDRALPREEAVIVTAKREAFEETGVEITDKDTVRTVSPLLFSSPGIMDESNAIALVVLNRDEEVRFTHDEAVGLESFGDILLVDRKEAKELLLKGTDGNGGFYSVYTWIALSVFVSGLWE
ncbi:MAG: NUDIX domain-containing protein, partial [Lachnospiraceae bacterium]|nr:NUDIX domain-containing protein [Lachnospiraceae bacterium]